MRRLMTVILALWPAHARAAVAAPEPPGASDVAVDLHWRAPSDCSDRAQVSARLQAALGSKAGELTIRVQVEGEAEGYRAQVQLRGPAGDVLRSLSSPTCETLVDAVVLLAEVSVGEAEVPEPVPEPEAVPSRSPEAVPAIASEGEPGAADPEVLPTERGDEPVEPEPVEPEPVPDPPPRSPSERSSSSPLRGVARLAARAGGGVMPQVDLSAALSVGVARRWWRVEFVGAGWLPREQPAAPDATVRIDLVSGELRGCGVISPRGWLGVLPCVGLDAGAMRGRGQGSGLAEGRTSWQPWVAIALTPAATLRLHPRVGLWVGGSLVVPLRRPGFSLQGQADEAYRVPPLSGRGALGVELYFP